MPAVLVHGNPETAAVWDPLRRELERTDVVALQLPGFGCSAPDGFGSTKEEYVDWLVAELERIGSDGPIDLVGHDWGGGFVLRVATTRPELVRSWVSDVAGLLHPEYVWHDFAQIWQAEGAGEEWLAATLAQPREERIGLLTSLGITPDEAAAFTDALDEDMGRCVLALSRSAAQPAMVEWGRDVAAAKQRPGLVLSPTGDPFTGGSGFASEMAAALGARHVELEGLGHWWMLEDPRRGAAELESFWASV
jgi:pimeloyl-ACP methyl ester carboxylesterase